MQVITPDHGEQACGEIGLGRLPEPEVLLERIRELGHDDILQGLRAVVTAGPTQEPIDAARFISNFSTGRMGCSIAQALVERGARVTLIHGPISVPVPEEVKSVPVTTAAEMLEAVLAHVDSCDVFVANAAVADWRPAGRPKAGKIDKGCGPMTLELVPTPDILATVGRRDRRPFLLGFSAETENLVENARSKLQSKGAHLMVANPIGPRQGFGDVPTTLEVVDAETVTRLGPDSKNHLARQLVDRIAHQLTVASSVIEFPDAARRHTHSG